MKPFDGDPPRIGISACLLGERVRYDGNHKRNNWLVDELGPRVTWIPVCPEVELGLGVPRETIDLIQIHPGDIRLVASQTGKDLTEAMTRYAADRVTALLAEDLAGYVLKTKSPSCGLTQVVLYDRSGGPDASAQPSRTGRGLFAQALLGRFPELPMVEEHQLATPEGRSDFIERIRRYRAR